MIEESEKYITLVKIEYNIKNTISRFNIHKALTELFQKMESQDPQLRILNTEKSTILWESNGALPIEDQFQAQFKMREQTYRSGNTKITLFCVIESINTINRMKYTEPIKTYIFNNNIWIRPDFYSTNVVSSPGFITLVHPKVTNKMDFKKELEETFKRTTIDSEDDAVIKWMQNKGITKYDGDTPIPKFHLETSIKKWGSIHTEVLSVHTAKETHNISNTYWW